ncbi:hypothetical protein AVEN_33995-1 [Araneus ventricosus]|uniref:Uncharacterized protein n=1 Tax=Araneus ventricosus TaxID=182803 RepID=A0A4Y2E6S8_ARAVE|nr:hypothetical protein AVEN_33995-1 [Araneus ventricosus]
MGYPNFTSEHTNLEYRITITGKKWGFATLAHYTESEICKLFNSSSPSRLSSSSGESENAEKRHPKKRVDSTQACAFLPLGDKFFKQPSMDG